MPILATDTAILAIGVCAVLAGIVAIVVIVAPWKGLRNEHPLPTDIETRLLLGEDPEAVAADADRIERSGASVRDLDVGSEPDAGRAGAFADLEGLGDEISEADTPPGAPAEGPADGAPDAAP